MIIYPEELGNILFVFQKEWVRARMWGEGDISIIYGDIIYIYNNYEVLMQISW